ncbi:hypothetical protein TNCT_607111 [Trichonephila clavata]|uniref:Uncharacterized protein n=1 Tax=Trichonephila clavata TaxID=2740835 RepID=A0A8X6IIA2_TRICU|nr:hypothetical protein TNCT_607111 [Trichonephila clavata]
MQPKKSTTWFLIHKTGSTTNNKEKRHASPLILLQITNQTNTFFQENPTKTSSHSKFFSLHFHLPIPPSPVDGEGKEARGKLENPMQVISKSGKKSACGGRVKLHPPDPIYVDEMPFDLNPSG